MKNYSVILREKILLQMREFHSLRHSRPYGFKSQRFVSTPDLFYNLMSNMCRAGVVERKIDNDDPRCMNYALTWEGLFYTAQLKKILEAENGVKLDKG